MSNIDDFYDDDSFVFVDTSLEGSTIQAFFTHKNKINLKFFFIV